MADDEEVSSHGGQEHEQENGQGQGHEEGREILIGGRRSGRAASFVAMAEALRVRTGVEPGPRPVLEQNKLPATVERDLDRQMKPGGRVVAESDGRAYRIVEHPQRLNGAPNLGTLRREVTKVKGKAARRADKKRRRLERERATRILFDGLDTIAKEQGS